MRKRKLRLALAILLLAVLGGLTWLVVASHEPPEPVYQGKRLSEWLDNIEWWDSFGGTMRDASGDQAVRQIGTNGIPTLLRMLRMHDSKFKLRLIWLVQKQHLIEFNFSYAAQRNEEAAAGFSLLGITASNAVPALVQIYEENISEWSQSETADVLGDMGPAATTTVSALLRTVTNTNASAFVRPDAALALGKIHAKPDIIIPALIKCLNDPDPHVQVNATAALLYYGSDAKAAVPALLDVLKDPNASAKAVTETARDALKAIDPEAAAKAGIK